MVKSSFRLISKSLSFDLVAVDNAVFPRDENESENLNDVQSFRCCAHCLSKRLSAVLGDLSDSRIGYRLYFSEPKIGNRTCWN